MSERSFVCRCEDVTVAELELREGRSQLPHFYDVLAQNYHRKGTPIYGDAVMRALLDELR